MESSNNKPYKNLIITVIILFSVSFVTIMINQVVQLVNLATMLNPYFGKGLLMIFVILGLAAVISIILILSRFERPLIIPDNSNTIEYGHYLAKLKIRLMKNKYLKKEGFVWDNNKSDLDSISGALAILDQESQNAVKSHASGIFSTTAISQNGSLDGIFVFVTAIKLVWRISMIYNQRPTISDLIKLYTNVFATVLLVRQIDDLDIISEQLEQVLPAVMTGSFGNVVPGISYVASFVADSILEGSLNTLLMLRICIITKDYCKSITKVEPKKLGKSATVQACKMLGDIISKDLKTVIEAWSKAAFNGIKKAPGKTLESIKNRINEKIQNSLGEAAMSDKE